MPNATTLAKAGAILIAANSRSSIEYAAYASVDAAREAMRAAYDIELERHEPLDEDNASACNEDDADLYIDEYDAIHWLVIPMPARCDTPLTKNPSEVIPCKLDCIAMPNGEVISKGCSLGSVRDWLDGDNPGESFLHMTR